MTGYRLPAGIISEAKDHMNMLGDFIAWMRTDALFEAMNGHSKEGCGGYGRWNAEEYAQHPEANDGDYAVAIFDAMSELSPLLPKDHMFGFSEGKLGIFYCPITIIVEPEEGKASIEALQSIAMLIEGLDATAKRLREEAGAEICRLGLKIKDTDKHFLQSACELARVSTGNGNEADFVLRRLKGEINYRINVKDRRG